MLNTGLLVLILATQFGMFWFIRKIFAHQKEQFDKIKYIVRTEMKADFKPAEFRQELRADLADLRRGLAKEEESLRDSIGAGVQRGLRSELDGLRTDLKSGLGKFQEEVRSDLKSARKVITEAGMKGPLITGQQIEWRAHLCHLLDIPFGALPATRHWAGSPDFLVHVAKLVLTHRPEVVVECGAGVSTLVIARALQLNGSGVVHTLEADRDFAEITRDRLRDLGVAQQSRVRYAPVVDLPEPWSGSWYRLDELEKLPEAIDLLVVDGPQVTETTSRGGAIDHLMPRLKATGRALFDDARRQKDEAGFGAILSKRFPHFNRINLPAEKGALLLEPLAPAPE